MKGNINKALLIAALLVLAFSRAASGDEPEDLIRSAREAAASDRHREAIRHYLAAVRADSSLAAELGKEIGYQYTWSEKPDSAVIWFERYLEKYPDDLDGMLGQARALSWADRTLESQMLYQRIQREHPQSVDARIGEARVTSWQDKNSEAEGIYREILKSHPENLEAQLGLARVINWQGRHREAREMYRGILESHPFSREAILGLALSQRWLGLDWKARKQLERITDNREARKILRSIDRERAPRLRFDYAISSDSDELVINRFRAALSGGVAAGTTASASAARVWMDQDDLPQVERTDFNAGSSRRFNEDWSLNLNLSWLHHSVDRDHPAYTGGDGFDLLAWDGWLTFTPSRRLRMDLSSSRMAVETPRSVQREISYSGAGLGADLLLTERIKAVCGYDYRAYSDANSRNLIKTALRVKLLSTPFRLEAVPGYTYFSYHQWKPNGYYNPEAYHNIGLKLILGLSITDSASLLIEGRGSGEKEGGEDWFAVGTFRTALEWKPAAYLQAGAEFFTSNSRVAGEAGYQRTLGGVYIIWIF
ncbi:MAG: tetratricopeptide repeat protein [Candidatus Krumholzibacteriota bacterium]